MVTLTLMFLGFRDHCLILYVGTGNTLLTSKTFAEDAEAPKSEIHQSLGKVVGLILPKGVDWLEPIAMPRLDSNQHS